MSTARRPSLRVVRCYDFPDIVVHDPECPRYNGGTCHPLPTPTPPYTDREKEAVEAAALFRTWRETGATPDEIAVVGSIEATGDTGSLRRKES